jgi:3-hydroxy-3-methylglutaryl CoA synthase/uncharacterized OB-fold protein
MTKPKDAANRFGILSVGAYLPRLRLDRAAVASSHAWMAPALKNLAKGARTMANWDEDSVTMAVEASRAALAAVPGCSVARLSLASTTLPFADRLNAGIVVSALGLSSDCSAMDTGGCLRAGASALLRALQTKQDRELVVASERRIPTPASASELLTGDGAAAILVGEGEPLAVLRGAAQTSADFVDHFRETGRNGDYAWEERWVRETGYAKIIPPVVARALAEAGCTAEEIDVFVMPAPLRRINQVVAKKLGVRAEAVADPLFESVGDTGTAHPLLMLANALHSASAGQKILVVQFGSGCDAMVLERTARPLPARPAWMNAGRPENRYLKYLSFTGQVDLDWGMRAEMDNKTALSAAWRSVDMVQGFSGGRCSRCGTVQFPSSRICVNPECGAIDTQAPHRLAEEGARIRSYTCDWLSYKQCPPFQFGHVEFESGARVLMEFTDSELDELAVGAPLRMVFRIKEVDPQRGFRRYFWKATAQRSGEEV